MYWDQTVPYYRTDHLSHMGTKIIEDKASTSVVCGLPCQCDFQEA